jgi:hypothetical protein
MQDRFGTLAKKKKAESMINNIKKKLPPYAAAR